MKLWLALLLCLIPTLASAQPVFDADHVGGPNSRRHAELWVPENANAPVPAIVLLHGCDGLRPHYRERAKLLQSWGYAVLLIDSFGPRGQSNVCGQGNLVPPSERAKDAFRGADYLRRQAGIKADRIGVIGFSHGGWTVMNLILQSKMAAAGGSPFAAAVAYYPACLEAGSPMTTDTLILIGDADDWTPAENCRRWVTRAQTNGHVLDLKIYPGARHAFDGTLPLRSYFGHMLGRDDIAAPLAEAEVKKFFAQRLMN